MAATHSSSSLVSAPSPFPSTNNAFTTSLFASAAAAGAQLRMDTISDIVRVPPSEFGRPLPVILEQRLRALYQGRVIGGSSSSSSSSSSSIPTTTTTNSTISIDPDNKTDSSTSQQPSVLALTAAVEGNKRKGGVVIGVCGISSIGACHVAPGEGASFVDTSFQAAVFEPQVGDILTTRIRGIEGPSTSASSSALLSSSSLVAPSLTAVNSVSSSSSSSSSSSLIGSMSAGGIRLHVCGGFDNVFVPAHLLPAGAVYDEVNKVWSWGSNGSTNMTGKVPASSSSSASASNNNNNKSSSLSTQQLTEIRRGSLVSIRVISVQYREATGPLSSLSSSSGASSSGMLSGASGSSSSSSLGAHPGGIGASSTQAAGSSSSSGGGSGSYNNDNNSSIFPGQKLPSHHSLVPVVVHPPANARSIGLDDDAFLEVGAGGPMTTTTNNNNVNMYNGMSDTWVICGGEDGDGAHLPALPQRKFGKEWTFPPTVVGGMASHRTTTDSYSSTQPVIALSTEDQLDYATHRSKIPRLQALLSSSTKVIPHSTTNNPSTGSSTSSSSTSISAKSTASFTVPVASAAPEHFLLPPWMGRIAAEVAGARRGGASGSMSVSVPTTNSPPGGGISSSNNSAGNSGSTGTSMIVICSLLEVLAAPSTDRERGSSSSHGHHHHHHQSQHHHHSSSSSSISSSNSGTSNTKTTLSAVTKPVAGAAAVTAQLAVAPVGEDKKDAQKRKR